MMLDTPPRSEGRLSGVSSAEHVGGARAWQAWEMMAAIALADTASTVLDAIRQGARGPWRRLVGGGTG